MEQNRPVPRRALSPKERRRRHRIRLVRNWTVFLLSCGAVMAVMTGGILWLLPRAYALIAPPTAFEAREYEGGAETDLSDKRLMLVNANLPLTEEPTPELAVADDATGVSLEAEAAAAYREMAEAAKQAVENDVHIVGVSSLAAGHLTLVPQIIAELKKLGREDIIVIVGGVIPAQDYDELYRDGAAAIFGPGTPIAKSAIKMLELLMAE